MKAITGCFKTTPTEALEFETALPPPELRLQKKVLRTFTRMLTLPEKHPLTKWMQRAITNRSPTKFISNLENIVARFPEQTATAIEKIFPYIRPPWWIPQIDIHIDSTKEKAKKHHTASRNKNESDPNTICIYTDGSGIEGNIGAAAYTPTITRTDYQHLGDESRYNVFGAELTAISLATGMVDDNPQYTRCIIYSDSQAAIKAIIKPGQQSGQSIIREILDRIEKLQQEREITFTLTWIPGHMEIDGNERVDMAAKEAAKGKGRIGRKTTSPTMKSARNAATYNTIKATWTKRWNEGRESARQLRRISKRHKVKSGPKLYINISNRQQLAWLIQMRTQHCSLNDYLHRFGIIDDPTCSCGETTETVAHYLLQCNNYEKEREVLRKEVGAGGMRVEKLLGYPNLIKHTLMFVENTKRFTF